LEALHKHDFLVSHKKKEAPTQEAQQVVVCLMAQLARQVQVQHKI